MILIINFKINLIFSINIYTYKMLIWNYSNINSLVRQLTFWYYRHSLAPSHEFLQLPSKKHIRTCWLGMPTYSNSAPSGHWWQFPCRNPDQWREGYLQGYWGLPRLLSKYAIHPLLNISQFPLASVHALMNKRSHMLK